MNKNLLFKLLKMLNFTNLLTFLHSFAKMNLVNSLFYYTNDGGL